MTLARNDPPPHEFSLPRSATGKLLFWTSTMLFIGFSLGVVVSEAALLPQPTCIEGQSTVISNPFLK
ncbi:hypothetical protein [Acidisoma sp. 7E03]